MLLWLAPTSGPNSRPAATKHCQAGRVGVEQEDPVEPEHTIAVDRELDLAADVGADPEIVEIEYYGRGRVAGVDFETEVELAVEVDVGISDILLMRGLEDIGELEEHSINGRSAELRRPADIQCRYELLHRGQGRSGIARSQGDAEFTFLELVVVARVDEVEQRLHLVETGVEIDDLGARVETREADTNVELDVAAAFRRQPFDPDQPEGGDVDLAGDVYAGVVRVRRHHENQADVEVGDVDADCVVAQFAGRDLVIAVVVGPVRAARTDEDGDVGGADRHRADIFGRDAVAERHVVRRAELERDAAGQDDRCRRD